MVGDLPERIIKRIFKKIYLRELFCDANPFQYVQALDTLQYYDNFNWLTEDFLSPETDNQFDGERIERLLCWSEQLA